MVIVAFALLAGPAAPLEIDWDAPADCPGAADVRASVERTLGPAADDERTPIRASGRVQESEAGYRLSLEVHDGATTSQRELEGATCREVTDAAALILAMTIDPRVALTEDPPSETSETEAAETKTVVPEVAAKKSGELVAPSEPVPPKVAPEPALPREPIAVHFLARAMVASAWVRCPDLPPRSRSRSGSVASCGASKRWGTTGRASKAMRPTIRADARAHRCGPWARADAWCQEFAPEG